MPCLGVSRGKYRNLMKTDLFEMLPKSLRAGIVYTVVIALALVRLVSPGTEQRLASAIFSAVVHTICVQKIKPAAESVRASIEASLPASARATRQPVWCDWHRTTPSPTSPRRSTGAKRR